MRKVFIGFVLGLVVSIAVLLAVQRYIATKIVDGIAYRFSPYVFHGDSFPFGYMVDGELLHRILYPVHVSVRYFDASYNEMTKPDRPGRYGAVVKIDMPSITTYRYITLFHTSAQQFWTDGPMMLSSQFPPNSGIDPAVVVQQQVQISQAIKQAAIGEGEATPDFAVLLAGLAELSPTDPPVVDRNNIYARDDAWWYGLRKKLGLASNYQFIVDLPQGFDADPSKKWPLILSLHGVGGGSSLEELRNEGVAGLIKNGKQFPAVVVSPLCPDSQWPWSLPMLHQLLDDISAKYRIDPDRIYLTGASAGGDNVWLLAEDEPDRFAALAPIAGEGCIPDAARVKDIPIWAFEGQDDEAVPPIQVIDMVNAVRQAGGHPHFTLYPNTGHDSWDKAYANDALFAWMLAQKRGQPEVLVPGVPAAGVTTP